MIFTIGRMNPPTSGHQGLIRKMMEAALENNRDKIYILLSGTMDNKKNPLSCELKTQLLIGDDMSNLVENLKWKWINEKTLTKVEIGKVRACQVIVVCMNDPTLDSKKYGKHPILKCIHYILDGSKSYDKSMLFVGEDRGKDFHWISKSSNSLGKFEIIPLKRPEGAISASYVRELAIEGFQDIFLEEMEKIGISHERGMEVYLEIRKKLVRHLKSPLPLRFKSPLKIKRKKGDEKK